MAEVVAIPNVDLRSFRIPVLPKLMFWFDFVLAVIVGKIIQSSGETSDPMLLFLMAPLLANPFMLFKVKFAELLGYLRAAVLAGLFLYAVRADLAHLDARQVFITAIVLGYHAVYVLMVLWYAKAKRAFAKLFTPN